MVQTDTVKNGTDRQRNKMGQTDTVKNGTDRQSKKWNRQTK